MLTAIGRNRKPVTTTAAVIFSRVATDSRSEILRKKRMSCRSLFRVGDIRSEALRAGYDGAEPRLRAVPSPRIAAPGRGRPRGGGYFPAPLAQPEPSAAGRPGTQPCILCWRWATRICSERLACWGLPEPPAARQLDWVNWRVPSKPLPVLMLQLPPHSHLREPVPHAAAGHPARRPQEVAAVPLGGGADGAVVDGAVPLVCSSAPSRAVRGKYRCRSARGRAKTTSWNVGGYGGYSDGRGRFCPSSMPLPRGAWVRPWGGPAVHHGGCEPVRSTDQAG
jgi:hypothetical protein